MSLKWAPSFYYILQMKCIFTYRYKTVVYYIYLIIFYRFHGFYIYDLSAGLFNDGLSGWLLLINGFILLCRKRYSIINT